MKSELRRAARSLGRSRGFVATAVVSLGLAIGLTTTIYSLLDAMIHPRVDVRAPDQLYRLRYFGDYHRRLPRGTVESALRSGLRGLDGVTGYRRFAPSSQQTTIEYGARFREVEPLVVRSDMFSVLGTRAVQGRTFTAADDGGAPVAVISDRLAPQLFPDGQSPLGATISVDGQPFTVIGIVPSSSVVPALNTDAWLLSTASTPLPVSLVRLRAGVTPDAENAELSVLAARLAAEADESVRETRFYLSPIAQEQFHLRGFHWALIAAVVAVLLVACGNLANLQLARGLGRGAELAVRSALGATRRQLVGMLMVESALLAAAGLVLGLVLAAWGIQFVRVTIPTRMAGYLVEPYVSWRLLVAAIGATVTCLLLVGLLPALRIARVDPSELIKSRSGTGAHKRHRRVYAVMIVAQIGLALPLLSGAVLMMRSAWRLDQASFLIQWRFGYDPRPIVDVNVNFVAPAGHAVPLAAVASDLVSRMRAIPDVADAAVSSGASPVNRSVTIEDADGMSREFPAPAWQYTLVSPSYMRTLSRSVANGRGSDFIEGAYGVPEALIDEGTALYLWPHANPVGRLMKLGDTPSTARWTRVIGVTHDLRDTTLLRIMDPSFGFRLGTVYRVFTPGDSAIATSAGVPLRIVVRAQRDAERTAVSVRHVLWSMPSLTTPYVLARKSDLNSQRSRQQFVAMIFTTFAVLGLALAALGVYGIVAHSVSARRREFGVRISLGATSRHILGDVLREGNVLALAGAAIGLFLTKNTVYMVSPFLNGMNDMYDAPLFAAMAAALVATVVVAALIPALRATRVDPVEALRSE